MSWSIGYDDNWKRDIGYGVPAYCDHPGCGKEIDRGLAYVCGDEPKGGAHGCGLYFCGDHHGGKHALCERCGSGKPTFTPTPDHPEWINHKMTDPSWQKWREENTAANREVYRIAVESMDDGHNVKCPRCWHWHGVTENFGC